MIRSLYAGRKTPSLSKTYGSQTSRTPFAVENLRNAVTAEKFKLKLRNQFEALRHSQVVVEEWDPMKTFVNKTAAEVIGKRRGTRIIQDTRKLIDERKEAK